MHSILGHFKIFVALLRFSTCCVVQMTSKFGSISHKLFRLNASWTSAVQIDVREFHVGLCGYLRCTVTKVIWQHFRGCKTVKLQVQQVAEVSLSAHQLNSMILLIR
ncbi:hypothetical protein Dsin_001119 [Dipteronia sinensis]|uniref:Secreted protein n=1 Tax=Dipteronia sinensis TaxID=43782 RepID=A0AAE0EI29_9ROSI|nr:hypothetical protein Dsin_001119 [Dipteronia sinensis]